MSNEIWAHLATKQTVDYLVTFAAVRGVVADGVRVIDRPSFSGQCIWNSNCDSMNKRYGTEVTPEKYLWRCRADPIPAMYIVKLCVMAMYESSACEDSFGYRLMRAIMMRAIIELPGYAEAPWSL